MPSQTTTADFDASNGAGMNVLCIHIAQKCIQAASVVGSASMPISLAWRMIKHKPVTLAGLTRTAGRIHLGALGLTAALGTFKVSQLDQDGIEDRGYRLYYNANQQRTDKFAQVGAGVGMAAAFLALRNVPNVTVINYVGVFSLGVTGGVLAHVLSNRQEAE